MADNTDQVQSSPQNEQNKGIDINFIQKEESIQIGCSAGDHMYKITELVPSGDLTSVYLECTLCGNKAVREERMNVNNMIDPNLPAPQQPKAVTPETIRREPYNPPKTEMSPTDVGRLDAFSRLRQEEKESDSFWDKIKKGA